MPDPEDEHLSEDSVLVKLAVSGDAQAFGLLYERYAGNIFRFLNAQLPDPFEAEDLTSEVFLRAWRALPGYQERGYPFSAFLFRIARNAVIDYRRVNKKRQTSSLDQVAELPDSSTGPAGLLANTQEAQRLRNALANLRESYRSVLVLRFINNLSPREVAAIMRRTEGAVRVLTHRALKAIKPSLLEQGEDDGD
jgi:RNA polymerase sigma-70 factor (ECF subfamily)